MEVDGKKSRRNGLQRDDWGLARQEKGRRGDIEMKEEKPNTEGRGGRAPQGIRKVDEVSRDENRHTRGPMD